MTCLICNGDSPISCQNFVCDKCCENLNKNCEFCSTLTKRLNPNSTKPVLKHSQILKLLKNLNIHDQVLIGIAYFSGLNIKTIASLKTNQICINDLDENLLSIVFHNCPINAKSYILNTTITKSSQSTLTVRPDLFFIDIVKSYISSRVLSSYLFDDENTQNSVKEMRERLYSEKIREIFHTVLQKTNLPVLPFEVLEKSFINITSDNNHYYRDTPIQPFIPKQNPFKNDVSSQPQQSTNLQPDDIKNIFLSSKLTLEAARRYYRLVFQCLEHFKTNDFQSISNEDVVSYALSLPVPSSINKVIMGFNFLYRHFNIDNHIKIINVKVIQQKFNKSQQQPPQKQPVITHTKIDNHLRKLLQPQHTQDYMDLKLENFKTIGMAKSYASSIRKIESFYQKPFDKISSEEVKNFLATNSHLSVSSLNGYLASFNYIYKLLNKPDYISYIHTKTKKDLEKITFIKPYKPDYHYFIDTTAFKNYNTALSYTSSIRRIETFYKTPIIDIPYEDIATFIKSFESNSNKKHLIFAVNFVFKILNINCKFIMKHKQVCFIENPIQNELFQCTQPEPEDIDEKNEIIELAKLMSENSTETDVDISSPPIHEHTVDDDEFNDIHCKGQCEIFDKDCLDCKFVTNCQELQFLAKKAESLGIKPYGKKHETLPKDTIVHLIENHKFCDIKTLTR